jgi:Fe-S-cluster-containing hydrogenase component 2
MISKSTRNFNECSVDDVRGGISVIFDMPSCGGCRTCEMACSFKHEEAFVPSRSSIKILDKKDGPGFLVFLVEESGGQEVACDGCLEFGVPLCIQYCRESEELKRIIKEFLERRETQKTYRRRAT